MVFSSEVFLFIFLPLVLALYFCIKPFRNLLLLLASLFFYAWGEPVYVILMLISIVANYTFGMLLEKNSKESIRKLILFICCLLNLAILGYFKYAGFLVANLNALGLNLNVPDISLPIGISFYTFQAMSYVIDVYRGQVPAQNNILNLGLYISMFPQLIAGPIVRYSTIQQEIDNRTVTVRDFYEGVKRFMFGFSKKILIADTVSKIADVAFSTASPSMNLAWMGAIAYTIQIYFDFSGYSDMAIGLGRMFGFHFLENFDYPYISRSIREFWRRWHMSLGQWFRDYVYIPLGGSRCKESRVCINYLIVFFLTGLWHGASWNFVVWGLWYAVFILLERFFDGKEAKIKLPSLILRIYSLLVIVLGWVFFRAETCSYALKYIRSMFSFKFDHSVWINVSFEEAVILILGIILATPLYSLIANKVKGKAEVVTDIIAVICFALGVMYMVGNGFSPFLYFRF